MSKQVLSIKQMQHLQELGLELKETMMYWTRCVDNNPRAIINSLDYPEVKWPDEEPRELVLKPINKE